MANAKRPVSINGLEFDALISEDRTLSSTVPEYPVENGYSVSDAIILSPELLSMTLFVTNTPVTWRNRHGISSARVQNVVKRLEQMYYNRTPVVIITTEKIYYNMAIENIGLSKNIETGPSREIPISFKKINVTSAKTTTIPDSYGKSGASGASAGTANTSTASADIGGSSSGSSSSSSSSGGTKSSILYSAAKGIGLIK